MKKLVVKDPDSCVQCGTCEQSCAEAFYKTAVQELSCIRIVTDRAGKDVIAHCNQCGKCAEVCPKFAISKNEDGVYVVDKELCVGCMACVDICPQNVICKSMDEIFVSKCVACGICADNCPMDVLAIEEA